MNNHTQQTDRKKAESWWRAKHSDYRQALTDQYFPGKSFAKLTQGEIESIWAFVTNREVDVQSDREKAFIWWEELGHNKQIDLRNTYNRWKKLDELDEWDISEIWRKETLPTTTGNEGELQVTEGEWIVEKIKDSPLHYILSSDKLIGRTSYPDNSEANAYMFAASKDMYLALKRCLEVFQELANNGHYPPPLMSQNGGEGFGFITTALSKANKNYKP